MFCLGIESTAHTFGIGIITDKGKILANERDIFRPERGGIKPIDAAKHHEKLCGTILENALKKAKIGLHDIDLIAYSAGPGMAPCLKVGLQFAKKLSSQIKKPVIGVNHCMAHVEIGKLTTDANDPITLYVSGGNSQVTGYLKGHYRVFGETLDIAIGNAIDKFGRALGLPFPAGTEIEKLAVGGKYVPLPYTVKGMDFSFTGLVTDAERKYKTGKFSVQDLCFSFQETAFAMLAEVSERVLAHTEKEELLVTGGVAANKRLSEMLKIMCEERGAKFFAVPKELAGDCGANIAWTGILVYKNMKKQTLPELDIYPRWRLDEKI